MLTENSVPINPHPCGTLIADLVHELTTVPTIALDLEDWESLCRTIDEYSKCRESVSPNNPVLDQQELRRLRGLRHGGPFEKWWTRGDSNPRPPHCERGITKAKTRRHNQLAF